MRNQMLHATWPVLKSHGSGLKPFTLLRIEKSGFQAVAMWRLDWGLAVRRNMW